MRASRRGTLLFSCLFMATLAAQSRASGQATARVVAPDRALHMLASGIPENLNSARMMIYAAFHSNYRHYSDADRVTLLDGVERVARGDAPADGVARERSMATAFAILRLVALDEMNVPEDARLPDRVLRIYMETSSRVSASLAVDLLANMLAVYPAQRSTIGDLLKEVASAPPSSGKVAPRVAIDALARAGEAGIPLLRELHEQRLVRDHEAAMILNALARRRYRRNLRSS